MQKLKVGIIGAGRIGQVHAKSITYHIPQAEIKAISDIYVEGAQKVAADLGIPNAYADYHDILNDPEIEAVLICSSTDTHADIACEAAEAGKHIFCEKPVDLTVAKIKKVIAAVEKAGVKLQIGFNRRYDHNFALNHQGEGVRKIAEVSVPALGRKMEVFTDQPGVQFYAGNFIAPEEGKAGATYNNRSGFALETQYYPDTIHHENFPSYIFGGENGDYDSVTVYKFE